MPQYFNPRDFSNPWGLKLTRFQQGLARVTPEEVAHYSDPKGGLEEAKATFSNISQNTVLEHNGTTYRGGPNPSIFTTESAKMAANRTSGIPRIENINQITSYLEPHNVHGGGCNTCGYATKGCSAACLAESGRMSFPNAHVARQARTSFGFENPAMYWGVMTHEANMFHANNIQNHLETLIRTGGTHEGMFDMFQGSEASFHPNPDIAKVEYSKTHSRGVIPRSEFYEPNHPNTTIVTSATEETTADRVRQSSEEQGRAVAVPVSRSPKARYSTDPESHTGVFVDSSGKTVKIPPLLTSDGRSLGDLSDTRNTDRDLSGIEGGLLYLGGKKVADKETGKKAVVDTTFIREVDPSRQVAKFQRHGEWKGEGSEPVEPSSTPISLSPRKGRTSSFRGE